MSTPHIYKSLVRSRIDYCAAAIASMSDTLVNKLETLQRKALRIALSARHNTPDAALYIESGEKPLRYHLDQRTLQYHITRQSQGTKNPINKSRKPTNLIMLRYRSVGKKSHSPYTHRAIQLTTKYELETNEHMPINETYDTLPILTLVNTPNIDISLHQTTDKENPLMAKTIANEHIERKYHQYIQIFTDGSKVGNKTGYGIYSADNELQQSKRITDNCSIFTAELRAIQKAVEHIEGSNQTHTKYAIFSDSLSSLMALDTMCCQSRNDILYPLCIQLDKLAKQNIDITIIWVPAHIGIHGNEKADKLAKNSLEHTQINDNTGRSAQEQISLANQAIKERWAIDWLQENSHKWNTVINKNKLKTSYTQYSTNRCEDGIITRLRLGKTKLPGDRIHIAGITQPNCTHCNEPEDIQHYFDSCPQHDTQRQILKTELRKQNIHEPYTIINLLQQESNGIHKLLIKYIKETDYIDKI